ncbi:MAG: tetratricopeptide repeat protein [Verrucomicrobiales bacterium]|nr:tetratricopeptide repeat protein [Verrucomicrobiales bacterium]
MPEGPPESLDPGQAAAWPPNGQQRVTLVFTDIVGSTRLKQALGERAGIERIQAHHRQVRELLAHFPDAVEAGTSGDSFLLLFAHPATAVRFALRLQQRLRAQAVGQAQPVFDRIGIHTGDIVVERKGADLELFGSDVDAAARLMALGGPDQILASQEACAAAQPELDRDAPAGLAPVRWQRYGRYRLRGIARPVTLTEVGEQGLARWKPPRRTSPDPLRTAIGTGTALVLLAGMVWLLSRPHDSPRPPTSTLALLAAGNPSDSAGDQTLLEGLVHVTLGRLAQLKQERALPLRLVPNTDLLAERVESVNEVRRRLGATHVLSLRWLQDLDRTRLSITLEDARTADTVGADILEVVDANLLSAGQRVAEQVVAWLKLAEAPLLPPMRGSTETTNAEAYRLYLQGMGELARYDPSLQASNAVRVLEGAVNLDPAFAPAFAALGEAYWRLFERTQDRPYIEDAFNSAVRAIELSTNQLPAAHFTLGLVRLGRGQPGQAIASFRQALNLDPGYVRARTWLARAYEEAGDYATAEAIHLEAARQDEGDWRAWRSLGVFYANRTDRLGDAERCFRRVIDLTPDNYSGYANLGGLLFLQGRFPEAARLLEQSIALKPTAQACSNLGTIRFFEHQFDQAAAWSLQATELDPRHYVWWGNLADARRHTDPAGTSAAAAYHEAVTLAEASLRVNRKQPLVLADLALYHAFLGNPEAARAALAEALAAGTADASVFLQAALASERIGQRPAALEFLREALRAGCPQHTVDRHPDLESLRQDSAAWAEIPAPPATQAGQPR